MSVESLPLPFLLLAVVMMMVVVNVPKHNVIIRRAHGAADGCPIAALEKRVKLNSVAAFPSSVWELLHFIPFAQQLEDMLIERGHEWWCVVFANASSDSTQTLSAEFIQQEILPAVKGLQQEQQDPSSGQVTAHVAVTDLGDACSYFDLYPFSHVFGRDAALGSLDRLELLESMERMVKEGRAVHGLRVNLEVPVVLVFRPGSAAYLREGRRWRENQLAKAQQQQPPLRMVANMERMMRFISELPQRAHTPLGTLAQRLLSDYKEAAANALSAGSGSDKSVSPLGIFSEEESLEHQKHLLSALQKMRKRWQAQQEEVGAKAYNLEALKGLTARQRVGELLKHLKKQRGHDSDTEGDAATAASYTETQTEAAETISAKDSMSTRTAAAEASEDLRHDL